MNTHTFTALATPFKEDGRIDYDSLDSLIKSQNQAGNALLLLGSTGEGISLSAQEKFDILEHVCKKDLSVPILAGIGGVSFQEVLRSLRVYESLPAIDGYLLTTPVYSKPGPKGQLAWFRSLLDEASKPCMLYNIPSRAGVSIAPEVLRELNGHPNFWALKEASGSLEEFRSYRDASPDIAFYCGNDELMPILVLEGAKGLVSVMGNVWPEFTRLYVDWSLQRKMILEGSLLKAIRCVNNRNPVSIKAILHALGRIASSHMRLPLSKEDGSDFEDLLEQNFIVDKWTKSKGVVAHVPINV